MFIFSTILTALTSCDFNKHIKDKVDDNIEFVKAEMDSTISLALTDFSKSYNQILQQSKDSVLTKKATALYSNIINTTKYIDSLRSEMNKLDAMDTQNVELVRQIFLSHGIGDSIFNKVRQSYSITIDMSPSDTAKARLRKVQETFSDENKTNFFGLSSPLSVNMVLYGIESELIKNGTINLIHQER